MVGRRIEQHDANQLELKLAYEIDPSLSKQRYGVEVFMYIPHTLGIRSDTYPKERFYEETAAFVRMKTPQVALSALATEGEAEQWFEAARKPLDELLGGDRTTIQSAIHSVKLLGCIYRRTMYDSAEGLVEQARLDVGPQQGRAPDTGEGLHEDVLLFASQIHSVVERLRKLGERCEQAAVPAVLADSWKAVDEYIALEAEEACTSVVAAVDKVLKAIPSADLKEAREVLADVAVEQYRYRQARNYPSYVDPNTENEGLPYRRHILKLIVFSVLFLDVRESESGGFAGDMVGMLAAAAAMLFAVLVTIWASTQFAMASMTFVFIAVASYMVKDRIKEWGKRNLGRRVARFLPDRTVEIRDQFSNALVGSCRETVAILKARKVDPLIRHLRHIDHDTAAAQAGRPETVIRYNKQMSLVSSALEARIGGIQGLNDIIRLNLGRLRDRMDEPYETHTIIEPSTREVLEVACARVYHVNLVLRFTTGVGKNSTTELDRIRIILDQRGIKRVTDVGLSGNGG